MPFITAQHIHPLGPKEQLPEAPPNFTYPFHYAPHPLAVLAAKDLQAHLSGPRSWHYDFGLDNLKKPGGQGKMFGVLVVKGSDGELGYLAAFSGKLADSNHLPGFVPPVFDLLVKDGYYKLGEAEINKINDRIERLEAAPELQQRQQTLATLQQQCEQQLAESRAQLKAAKKDRKTRREAGRTSLTPEDFIQLEAKLAKESVTGQLAHKNMQRAFNHQLTAATATLAELTDEIAHLKQLRKDKSNALQHWIFSQYRFLDAEGNTRDLPDIFADTAFKKPIAGAGECAAPKLLQYAYQHQLKPIVMAEFWWGQAPVSAIRQHLNYYPACRGKCYPILSHMLKGLDVDPNPLNSSLVADKQLEFVYEDEHIIVVNKPADFLSVPGKQIVDSVQSRLIRQFPASTGPLIVHRLDMATSGLLLCAKHKEAHKKLQSQFLKRTIKKRYLALLDGTLVEDDGAIDLALRQDVEDRPRQIVDKKHGKSARTNWKKLVEKDGQTLVHFWPITGRTHQLRMHAAHPEGLGIPIVGDRLYGKRANRLCLHAEWIEFEHPVSGERLAFQVDVEFARSLKG